VVDKFGFDSEEKRKAVADLEAMVTAQTGFPWSVPRVNPPPVDFIKPDPEDLEREWQQALERQRSLFGPPPPREAVPVTEEGIVKEAFVQFVKGEPPAMLYLSTDQKKTMIILSQKELMKKSANFLKQLYEVAVLSHEEDQSFKELCLKFLFQMASEKMKLELQYESRFDTDRVLSHPKRIFHKRYKKKNLHITFEEIPKLDTLAKIRKFRKIFFNPEPRNPLEEEALALLKKRYDELMFAKTKGKKKKIL
jgi:hypothetical protein